MNVVFDHREQVAADTISFWFKPERPVDYVAGQFTEIYLPHAGADNRGERRWFTLSSSPTDSLVSITTRLAVDDSSTFKKELYSLRPGAALKLADPMGDFVLPKDPAIPLLFAAGGLGITPVHSMVKWLHDTGERRRIRLVYAVSRVEEATFLPLFETYKPLELTLVVKHPLRLRGYNGETGSLSTERIVKYMLDFSGHSGGNLSNTGNTGNIQVYLSGPEPMTETFYKGLTALGFPGEQLVTDYFPGYAEF